MTSTGTGMTVPIADTMTNSTGSSGYTATGSLDPNYMNHTVTTMYDDMGNPIDPTMMTPTSGTVDNTMMNPDGTYPTLPIDITSPEYLATGGQTGMNGTYYNASGLNNGTGTSMTPGMEGMYGTNGTGEGYNTYPGMNGTDPNNMYGSTPGTTYPYGTATGPDMTGMNVNESEMYANGTITYYNPDGTVAYTEGMNGSYMNETYQGMGNAPPMTGPVTDYGYGGYMEQTHHHEGTKFLDGCWSMSYSPQEFFACLSTTHEDTHYATPGPMTTPPPMQYPEDYGNYMDNGTCEGCDYQNNSPDYYEEDTQYTDTTSMDNEYILWDNWWNTCYDTHKDINDCENLYMQCTDFDCNDPEVCGCPMADSEYLAPVAAFARKFKLNLKSKKR